MKNFESLSIDCVDPNVDGDAKKQGIRMAADRPNGGQIMLVFDRATHGQIDDLTKQLRKLGLNEVRTT